MKNTSPRHAPAERLSPAHWVIIPAFNEEKYLGKLLAKVQPFTSNIIVVDDGSQDHTYDEAKKLTPHVVRHTLNLGKGAALKTGCEYAFSQQKAHAVILMDGDDQHSADELLYFEHELNAGEKLVLGTRSLWEMPFLRSWSNRFVSALIVLLFGGYIPDILSGYKAFSEDMYRQIKWETANYAVEVEIAARIATYKLPYKSVPITTIYHDFDRGMSLLDTSAIIWEIINLRLKL